MKVDSEILVETSTLPWMRRVRRAGVSWLDLMAGKQRHAWWHRLSAVNLVLLALPPLLLGACVVRALRPVRLEDRPRVQRLGQAPAIKTEHDRADFDSAKLEGLRNSTLFGSSASAPVGARAGQMNSNLAELSKNLQLQGILGGGNPRAIILYVPTQQLHYLSAGEFIGQIQVVEVRPTSVLLAWNKETIEIGL